MFFIILKDKGYRVPLVPEPIGPIDQFSLNVFSVANALAFTLFN